MNEHITVLADGCLDPMHEGHIAYLDAAKALGTRLVVNTVTDAEIWQKRPTIGPFLPAESRLAVLRGLRAVDEVVVMDTLDALRTVKPQIYAKGKDWEGRLPEAELKVCAELGITVKYLDTVHNSSTALLKKFIAQLK
ncbi:MAG: adenylyltransferase/cytidyltransferase family protein [Candidatus Kerfeldbacteria bacterium]|nr:adenylyltransferase/cytidyltransferase family protein [Candidatus Kerfeldbacteria bacterium]